MTKNHTINQIPLRALQVFEAAARHQNLTRAGQELGITQSAVSRKVSELEATLAVSLFHRSGPSLTLTTAGHLLADRVSLALRDLLRAFNEIKAETGDQVVTLSMLPSVASKWLAPKLGDFISRHPEIDLRISASRTLVDFARDGIDGAIRYGPGTWPGLDAVWLGSETVQPVCAPELLETYQLKQPADLIKAPLLHADIAEDWSTWFHAAGVRDPVPGGPRLGDDTAILQAAQSGQGVALGRSRLIADDLETGRLIAPFDLALDASYSYWFVTPVGDNSSILETVRDWFIEKFSSDRQRQ